jgi:hypothetical protein
MWPNHTWPNVDSTASKWAWRYDCQPNEPEMLLDDMPAYVHPSECQKL